MQAVNVLSEYRRKHSTYPSSDGVLSVFIENRVSEGTWVEDDGDYYTREEWESQYPSEGELVLDTMIAEDWDAYYAEEQPDRDECNCGHPECGAC